MGPRFPAPHQDGEKNPFYTGPCVFDNDFPALLPGEAVETHPSHPLVSGEVAGTRRVVCFSPRHD